VDRFASKSNLRASVINVHGGGVGLMVVLSVFSERVSNLKLPMYVFKRANGSHL
jgi:hypothetical protein